MLTGFLQFLERTPLSLFVANSRYGAMVLQTFHVLGFTLLLAIVVAYNIRTQNIALRSLSLGKFAAALGRYYHSALLVALVAGFVLGMPRAVTYWGNVAFVYKIALLAPAIVLQFILHHRALATAEGADASVPLRVVAVLSLLLWFIVGAAGRAIGFVA